MAMDNVFGNLFGSLGGFAPQDPYEDLLKDYYDPRAAKWSMAGSMLAGLGTGLMTRDWAKAAEVSGQGMTSYRDNAMKRYAAAQMMSAAEEKKQKRQEEADQKAQFENWVKTLPPDQQGLARMFPDKYGAHMVKQQFPDQQEDGSPSYYGVPIPYTKPDGTIGYGLPSKDGSFKPLDAPGGASFLSPGDKAFQQKAGGAEGTAIGEAKGALPGAKRQAEITESKITELEDNKNLDAALGWTSYAPDWAVSSEVIDVRSKVDELMGGAFLEARTVLKGGGQITDFESSRAERAYARMERAIQAGKPEVFRGALADFRQAIRDGVSKLEATARSAPSAPGGAPAPAAGGAPAEDPLGLR